MNAFKEISVPRDIHQVNTLWDGKMHFKSSVNDHIIHLDKLSKHGGEDKGPRPKPLILSAVGGCAGMEIISILEKMRLKIDGLEIEVGGELNYEVPKIYKSVHIIFKIRSDGTQKKKIERAIHLATEKYCGVLAMVRHFAEVTSEIRFI